jgi:hypothetical protein
MITTNSIQITTEKNQHYLVGGVDRLAIFTQLSEFINSFKTIIQTPFDKEGLTDAIIRIFSCSSGFSYSALSLFEIGVSLASIIKSYTPIITPFARVLPPLGLSVSLLEIAFSSIQAHRNRLFLSSLSTKDFEKMLSSNPEKLRQLGEKHLTDKIKVAFQNLDAPENKEKILDWITNTCLLNDLIHLKNTYLPLESQAITDLALTTLQVQNKNISRQNNLARRVQPWCQERICEQLPSILEKMQSNDPEKVRRGQEEAKSLMKTVRIQGEKAKLIHILAITSLTICSIGFIGAMIAAPYLIPLVLLIIGSTLSLGAHIYSTSTLPCDGWTYNTKHCVPNWFKSLVLRMDLERDDRILQQIRNEETPNPEKSEQIEDPYKKTQANLEIIKKLIAEDNEEKIKEAEIIKEKIRLVSIYHFHLAEDLFLAKKKEGF